MIQTLSTSDQIKNFLGAEPLQAASLRVTLGCNLRCKQCYAIAGKPLPNELSLMEVKKLLDDLKALGAIRIFFTGGEPFFRRDMVDIMKYADDNGFAMYISTNGTLVRPDTIEALSHLKHLRTFQISIDGIGKLHDDIRGVPGTFNKAVNTIKMAVNKLHNTKVAVISTLMKSNANQMEKIMDFAINEHADTFGIVTLYPIKRSSDANDISTKDKYELFERLSTLYQSKKTKLKIGLLIPPALMPAKLQEIEYGCGYVCSFPSLLGISSNGDVAPCDGLLKYKNFILGNIREQSLKQIWEHPLMVHLRSITPSDITGVCQKCKHLSFCMGGCRARAYIDHGNFTSSNPLCESFYEAGFFPLYSLRHN
ncbi:MAG: Radical SAM domain protein [Candidatus Gottesmanbacteria bacterium GW2011_GWB1_49_7]|uniref:Radical SAM domain protein n=1 Tax=Candidatus Gottesmanbacteria bacterium GW2011_GWB1_49_7 TaxID=1618448 RepID=A0A0G1W2I7_9BACT|nr:MAG: Radical SAM domain protein [Candidatus Gottesmanbacteria bacterium GW2011_GWB1_49_7]